MCLLYSDFLKGASVEKSYALKKWMHTLEVVSKPSIGFKVKAELSGQPQEYISILRIGHHAPTPDLGPRGGFETTSTVKFDLNIILSANRFAQPLLWFYLHYVRFSLKSAGPLFLRRLVC
jgi:hypothetical protein